MPGLRTAEAAPAADEEDLIVPFTGMRKAIADHLVKSAFTAPHVTTVAEADVTRMVAYRAANKDTWEREYKLRLTYTPFFVKATADALLEQAAMLEAEGAFALVLEYVPEEVARRVTEELAIPTIGIGAGPGCDGQVLVSYDMLGLTQDSLPSFVRQYARLDAAIIEAVAAYRDDVRQGRFPAPEKEQR